MKKSSVLILLVFLMGSVFAFDVSEYDYKLSLTPECLEYMGYVKFEFPVEFGGTEDFSVYSDDDIFVDSGIGGFGINRNRDWFINSLPGYGVREIEAVSDGDFGSDLVVSGSSVEMFFQNPLKVGVDKIIIDTKDSLVDSFEVTSGKFVVNFDLKQDKFHYELDLDDFAENRDSIRIVLNFNGVLKIREISFFNEIEYDGGTYGYFYVDDDCNRTREVYFGEFGENRFSRGVKSLPVYFGVNSRLMENSEYDEDFDDDGVLNEEDNCLDVSNVDQKDIDYNGVGDACDDFDRDGVLNIEDNCVRDSNRGQEDGDDDGIGDACDDEDGRFFEKNIEVLILLIVVIIGAFGFFTYRILRD